MTRLDAAREIERNSRAALVRALENAAHELKREAAAVYLGNTFQGNRIAEKLAAVAEARDLLDAAGEGVVAVVRQAGAA